jgi:hypothetical protein
MKHKSRLFNAIAKRLGKYNKKYNTDLALVSLNTHQELMMIVTNISRYTFMIPNEKIPERIMLAKIANQIKVDIVAGKLVDLIKIDKIVDEKGKEQLQVSIDIKRVKL